MKKPKDLGIKIGSKDEVFWKDMVTKMEEGLQNAKHEIEINNLVLEHAKLRIIEEREKFK